MLQNDLQRQLVQMNNPAHHRPPPARGVAAENQPKFQRSFIDGDFDFVSVCVCVCVCAFISLMCCCYVVRLDNRTAPP